MGSKGKVIGMLHEIDDPAALREIADEARRLSRQVGKARFSKGMTVAFTPSKGKEAGTPTVGEIVRVNKKTVTVKKLRHAETGERSIYGKYRITPDSDWWDEVPATGEVPEVPPSRSMAL